MNYILLFVYFLILSILEIKNRKINQFYWYVGILLMVLSSSFRAESGYDIENYMNLYYGMDSLTAVMNSYMEIGYSIINYIFNSLGFNFYIMLLVINFFSIGIKAYVFEKTFSYKYIPLLLYSISFFFNYENAQLRSGLAMALCMLAIMNYTDKRKYIIISLVASSIHISAAITFLIPFFDYFFTQISKSKIRLIIFVLILLILSQVDLFSFFKIINDSILHNEYLRIKLIEYQSSSIGIMSSTFIVRCLFLIGFYEFVIKNRNIKINKTLWMAYVFNIVFFLAFNSIPILVERSTAYLRIYEFYFICLLIEDLVNKRKNNNLINNFKFNYLSYIFLAFFFVYYIYKFITTLIDPHYIISNFLIFK